MFPPASGWLLVSLDQDKRNEFGGWERRCGVGARTELTRAPGLPLSPLLVLPSHTPNPCTPCLKPFRGICSHLKKWGKKKEEIT